MVDAPPAVRAWVATRVGAVDRWDDLPQTDELGPWRLTLASGERAVVKLGPVGDPGLATEVAALELCATHEVPAPRLLAADPSGADAGQPAVVETWLAGTSRVPGPDEPPRGRAIGAAAAAIHAVVVGPTATLPERRSSLEGLPWATLPVPAPAADLFAAAREAVASTPAPDAPVGLVHGDLWQGNTLWDDDGHVGTLDWDFAGVGHPTVDLGSLRWDLAVLVGAGADDVVTGWSEASGTALGPEVVARADLVAVLASPPDLALWLGNVHAQGCTELTLEVVTARRDAFARQALEVLR